MRELCAAAGCAFAEVALLQKENVVPARCSVDGDTDAGSPAAHDDDVPRLRVGLDAPQHFVSIHGSISDGNVPSCNVRGLNNDRADPAGDQRAKDWYQRVAPIRISLATNRKDCMRHAGSKIPRWIHRVSGRPAKA